MRDKLVELINHAKEMREADAMDIVRESECDIFDKLAALRSEAEYISDHLIANGVTVQEFALPKEDYYVLRNTETGMYFRGKGVNRWGKHFNQATIYRVKGTAEHSIKDIAWHGEKAELVRIKIAETPAPPKGE